MNRTHGDLARRYLAQAKHSLGRHHLPRILRCLQGLSESDVWWRPNAASNSAGNLVLHLEGNVRQWILSGLGGAPDRRQRDREFGERGPLARHILAARLRKTVQEACRVIAKLPERELERVHTIQKFRVTGFEAIHHVTEHFALHTGQILYITKLRRGRDLGFTRLPGEKQRRAAAKRLPVI
jgi:uncharacterized damage-inducible protein DinB